MGLQKVAKQVLKMEHFGTGGAKKWQSSVQDGTPGRGGLKQMQNEFIKVGRCEDGKGNYWSIHPQNLPEFKKGDFKQKQRYGSENMILSTSWLKNLYMG